jgi:hypothetical protein
MRNHRIMAGTGAGTFLLLAAPLLGGAAAQTIAGRVVEQESGAPLPVAQVALEDSAGMARAVALSDSAGAFVLRAPAPGRYRLRAEHIGRATIESDWLTVAAGGSAQVRLEAPIAAVLVRGIVVEGSPRCSLRPAEGEALAQIWEEVRKAFRLAALLRRSTPFAQRRYWRDMTGRTLAVRREIFEDTVSRSTRPFATGASEEDLHRQGYVRPDGNGWAMWGPDDEVMLSDGFLDHHCLRLVTGGRAEPGRIGVAFEPVGEGSRGEIKGVVWLSRATAELQRVDFEYVRLPDVRLLGEGMRPIGGRVEFARLASGGIVVSRWYVRTAIRGPMAGVQDGQVQLGRPARAGYSGVLEIGGEVEGLSPVAPDTVSTSGGGTEPPPAPDSTSARPGRGGSGRGPLFAP